MAGGGWGEAEDLRSSTWPMRRDGKKGFFYLYYLFFIIYNCKNSAAQIEKLAMSYCFLVRDKEINVCSVQETARN